MSKVSIIGCGWLGLPLGTYLTQQGYTVLGSSTTPAKLATLASAGIRPFLIRANPALEGDDLASFFDVPTLIISVPPRRRRAEVEDVHFAEVKSIIDAAAAGTVRQIIYCSSTGVYPNNNALTKETDPVAPATASSRAIWRIEEYLRAKESMAHVILRFAGLVGGERKAGRFLAGRQDLPNGSAPVNLIHRMDCIRIIHEIIRQDIRGETFNVCADQHPLRRAFYPQQAIQQNLEPPTFLATEEAAYKIISNEKVKRALDYTLQYPDPMLFD